MVSRELARPNPDDNIQMKKVLITGAGGQTASYLAEYLLSLGGFKVFGMIRRNSTPENQENRISHLEDRITTFYGDLTDPASIDMILKAVKPDYIFNLAAQSHVRISYDIPSYTVQANALGVLNLLESMRVNCPKARLLQASSSEMFGDSVDEDGYQRESTHMTPVSPYGCSKLFAYSLIRNYRIAYKLHLCNSICFNHESPRRGSNFVTNKVVKAAVRIKLGLQDKLELGNMDSYRDWGHAKDYCIDLDTKILTTNGFKFRHEISIGDTIINYNTDINRWERDTIDDIYDIEHIGDMFLFKGNLFEFRCSPNHRLFYQHKTTASKNWSKNKEISAREFHDMINDLSKRGRYNYRLIGIQEIESVEDFDIPDNMLKLMGYIISEGCLSKSKKIGGGTNLSVSQSKKKYYVDLKKCIDDIGLLYRERIRIDEVSEFIFDAVSREKVLTYFDGFDIHELPNFIYRLSKRQLQILFTSMMNGDGCWSAMKYTTIRYSIATKFQDLCALIGLLTKIRRRKSGIYDIQIFSKAKNSTYNYVTESVVEKQQEENLWCIKSHKNGTIITKKEGHGIFSSGNCRAMLMIIIQEEPSDYVVSTGETRSVREMCDYVFSKLDLDYTNYIVQNPKFLRPQELPYLKGDSSRIRRKGWKPTYTFETMLDEMIGYWESVYKEKL